MKIEYRLTFKDYKEANKFHLKTQTFQYLWHYFLICFFVMAGIFSIILVSHLHVILFSSVLVIIAIVTHPGINFINNFRMSFAWKNQPSVLCESAEIEVLEQGLSKEAKSYQSFVRWSVFSKFIETPNLFILYEGKYLMHIIPKRAFHSNEQIQEFKTQLNEKISESN